MPSPPLPAVSHKKSVASFFIAHSEVRCFILNQIAPYLVVSTKSTFQSPLHPKSLACEGEFELISAFCCYETKSVSGIYQTFHNED